MGKDLNYTFDRGLLSRLYKNYKMGNRDSKLSPQNMT